VPRKLSFDPRKLMEQAIEVMRQSVHEPRKDGKASPLVGAVLHKPDGTVEKFSVRHGSKPIKINENGNEAASKT